MKTIIIALIIFIATALHSVNAQSLVPNGIYAVIAIDNYGSNDTNYVNQKNIENIADWTSPDSSVYKVKNVITLTERGGRVDWSPKGDLIAFDRKEDDGYYDIYIIGIDGAGEKCLTCSNSDNPLHNGNPVWHPSGNYIVFQAQNPNLNAPFIEKWATHPGGGINNNLWVANKDGTKFWQLTNFNNRMGVIHPHFSHKGDKLMWAERVDTKPPFWGQWAIKIAQFDIESDELKINNIIDLRPGDMGLYETHGFSPDDGQITFSASKREEPTQGFDEFIYDLNTKKLTSLTNSPKEWDEFAQYTPDGKHIVWTSSLETVQERNQKGDIVANKAKLEYWIMNPDGTNKQRLTHFNAPGYSEYTPNGISAADFSFKPGGSKIAAKIRNLPSKFDEAEKIIIIDIEK